MENKSEEKLQKIILALYKYQKYVNSGMVGNSFVGDNFINNLTCTNEISCKMTLLKNINVDLLEKCKVSQLYVIGNVLETENLKSYNYILENLDVDNVYLLKYLVGLEKTLEEK